MNETSSVHNCGSKHSIPHALKYLTPCDLYKWLAPKHISLNLGPISFSVKRAFLTTTGFSDKNHIIVKIFSFMFFQKDKNKSSRQGESWLLTHNLHFRVM